MTAKRGLVSKTGPFLTTSATNGGGRLYSNKWSHPLCEMSLHDALVEYALGAHGHVVPLWEDDHEAQEQWCRETLRGRWISRRKFVTADQLNDELEARFSQGHLGPSVQPLKIESVKVQAASRRLGATWAMELPQTIEHAYNTDVEQDIMDMLAQEISAEIDQEMLRAFSTQPGTPSNLRKQLRRAQAVWHFAFQDAKEATLFKLTWGGE